MTDTSITGQPKRVLFLISLPESGFEACKDDIALCIQKLSERNVDVRKNISKEDLMGIKEYDLVIVVSHYDMNQDALLLADDVMMPMSEFVESLPKDFEGVLDMSSCYSANVARQIKSRCPHCMVQAAVGMTGLEVRLFMYPYVIDIMNADSSRSYHDIYTEVLNDIQDFARQNKDVEGSKTTTKLGEQQMTSVYSPREVMRNSVFQILVFFHYDSEKKVVMVKAVRRQNDAEVVGEISEIPISLKKDDEIAITLGFDLGFESTDNANIKVKNDEYTKYITLKEEMVEEEFIVTLLPDFQRNSLLAQIEFAKDGECFARTKFNIIVTDRINKAPADIEMEIPQQPKDLEDKITCYADVFTARIFDSDKYREFQQILFKNYADPDKLHFIRRFIYNNDLFLERLKNFVDVELIGKELTKIKEKEDSKDRTIIFYEIAPLLKRCLIKIQERLGTLESKFKSVKIKACGNLNFDAALPKIPSLEREFIDLSSEIKCIDYQIQMLKLYQELRDFLNKLKKRNKISKDDIKEIKDFASDFWDYPHKHLVDQDLFGILRTKCNPGAIKSSKSGGDRGVTMPYLALLLAMVCGEYISIDNGKEDWFINIAGYIDLSKYKGSLRTPKNRINNFISVLKSQDVRNSISQYMKKPEGKMSVSARLLLNIKI